MNKRLREALSALFFFFSFSIVFAFGIWSGGCTTLHKQSDVHEITKYRPDGKTIREVVVQSTGGYTYWFFLNSDATINVVVDGKVVGTVHVAKNDIITADSLQAMVEKYFSNDLQIERIKAKNSVDLAKLSKSSSSSSSSEETETADGSDMDNAINIDDTSIRWKPTSANDGNLAVLTPSDQDSDEVIKVWDKDGNLMDELNYVGRTNGERPTYRSNHSGSDLATESGGRVYISIASKDDDGEEDEDARMWYYAAEADQDYNK